MSKNIKKYNHYYPFHVVEGDGEESMYGTAATTTTTSSSLSTEYNEDDLFVWQQQQQQHRKQERNTTRRPGPDTSMISIPAAPVRLLDNDDDEEDEQQNSSSSFSFANEAWAGNVIDDSKRASAHNRMMSSSYEWSMSNLGFSNLNLQDAPPKNLESTPDKNSSTLDSSSDDDNDDDDDERLYYDNHGDYCYRLEDDDEENSSSGGNGDSVNHSNGEMLVLPVAPPILQTFKEQQMKKRRVRAQRAMAVGGTVVGFAVGGPIGAWVVGSGGYLLTKTAGKAREKYHKKKREEEDKERNNNGQEPQPQKIFAWAGCGIISYKE